MIFVNFFGVSLENALWRFWALKGPNLGSKNWFESDENRKLKKRLVTRRLGNSYFPKNGPTTPRSTQGRVPGRGVGGMDKSIPGGMDGFENSKASRNSKAMFEEGP